MTVDAMWSEFQLYYNNISSYQAPGLDKYEVSVYLTKNQENWVDAMYAIYEQNESARKKLASLVTTVSLAPSSLGNKITNQSTIFELPNDLLYVVGESVTYGKTEDKCDSFKTVGVYLVAHDDFDRVYSNPFKFSKRQALRLDLSTAVTDGVNENTRLAEIVSKVSPVEKYNIRYIRKPRPIILEDLDSPDNINGETHKQTCELDESVQRQIIELAAQDAYKDYLYSASS